MDVTDVLRDRMRRAGRASARWSSCRSPRTSCCSRRFMLAPGALAVGARTRSRASVMTITLGGGGEGPQNGGMTAMGGRPVQAETPPERAEAPKPVRPPAAADAGDDGARRPERSRRRPSPRRGEAGARRGARADADARARKRAPGSARRRDRRARAGVRAVDGRRRRRPARTLDVGDFCCPDYLDDDGRRASAANWTREPGRRGADHHQVHDSARRHASATSMLEQSSGYHRRSIWPRSARSS